VAPTTANGPPLAVGQALPTVPSSLEAELCVAVDLEAAYLDACRRRRLDEVVLGT
jgi:hypothetical protein